MDGIKRKLEVSYMVVINNKRYRNSKIKNYFSPYRKSAQGTYTMKRTNRFKSKLT